MDQKDRLGSSVIFSLPSFAVAMEDKISLEIKHREYLDSPMELCGRDTVSHLWQG